MDSIHNNKKNSSILVMIPSLHPLGSNMDVSIIHSTDIVTVNAAFGKPLVCSPHCIWRSLPAGSQFWKVWEDMQSLQNEMLNVKILHQLPSTEDGTISSTALTNGVRSAIKHGAIALLPGQRAPWPSEGEESCRRCRAVRCSMCLTQLRAPSQGCFGRRKANTAL